MNDKFSIDKLVRDGFTAEQIKEIALGFKANLHEDLVSIYAKVFIDHKMMKQCRIALKRNFSIKQVERLIDLSDDAGEFIRRMNIILKGQFDEHIIKFYSHEIMGEWHHYYGCLCGSEFQDMPSAEKHALRENRRRFEEMEKGK